ncbi:hypothetical protein [Parvibaculum sp. MBR-TMA-1.3b-4.2]|jgi:hypothetical protein
MIDRTARDKAASLAQRFICGEITNDDLEDEWPTRSEDPAVRAVNDALWFLYDDNRTHRIDLSETAPEIRDELSRCILFLRSKLPYEWPEKRLIFFNQVPLAFRILSLGLMEPLHAWLGKRHRRIEEEMNAAGDMSVWPFIRADEYTQLLHTCDDPLRPPS